MRAGWPARVRSLAAAVVAVLIPMVLPGEPPGDRLPARPGFYVSDGRLYDAHHRDFVMRGVSHMHTTYPERTAATFAHIKALGANTVRVELSMGAVRPRNDAADVAEVIALCKRHRLICVLVVSDTTGWGRRYGAVPQAEAVDYWLSVGPVLVGQEKYVVINVANEPYVLDNYHTWPEDTVDSINRLRRGGLRHTLMVDAPDWGQDWSFTMRDNAATVFHGDPARNTVFSIHMYGAFDRAPKVTDYLDRYVRAGLPVVVSEFGHLHSDGAVDEDAIMAEARAHGLGYVGWSWSGNGGDVHYLDMVTGFDPDTLTDWGKKIFLGPDGIRATSREAAVYPPRR